MREVRRPLISVIGAARANAEQAQAAEVVGRLLAERGVILVCGGRRGVMEAACRGAVEAGGITIGILPGKDPEEGNPYLTAALPSGLGQARNALVVQAGWAVIAIGGGYGTLSEIALALKAGKRVVGLSTWQATDSYGHPMGVLTASTPEEAVAMALSTETSGSSIGGR